MIISPFTVRVKNRKYDFVDRESIDNGAERADIKTTIMQYLDLQQDAAKCAAIGVEEVGGIENFTFGAYEGGTFVGVYLLTTCDYVSGPWEDLVLWEEINTNVAAIFTGRPMPGFATLNEADEIDLSVEIAHDLLTRELDTVDGHKISFSKLSWAIFKDRTNPQSIKSKKIHDAAKADSRLKMTETFDINDSALTRVDLEKK